jgi:hypothetical protein
MAIGKFMVLLRDGFQQVCWDKTLFFSEISSLPQLDDRSVFQRTYPADAVRQGYHKASAAGYPSI